MRPIRAIAIAAFAFGLTLSMAPLAQRPAVEYHVLKCHCLSRSASEVEAAAAGPYQTADSCAAPTSGSRSAVTASVCRVSPATCASPLHHDTAIVGVIADANLRRDNHHFAQLAAVDYQGNSRVLAQGSDQAPASRTTRSRGSTTCASSSSSSAATPAAARTPPGPRVREEHRSRAGGPDAPGVT